jgi:hypothetical protein
MRRTFLLLTVAAVIAVMMVSSTAPAFAAGKAYGWGANDCYTDIYNYGGPGCGYHGALR